ncbi:MAG: tRNA preQ1(34) S-adenosylmethionine ribosyltransferase-isomerase QueA [Proteobacteria bacterium]|nr:tRNA preQ1(34) S-adenosylmethionine ribosyltransferase-isomerase QueA [Pseudomonadota bacterium]
MRLSDFDFDLPEGLIAQAPASPRDSARLLHVGATLADRRVSELPGLLKRGDLLVYNDTRVLKARLTGMRGAAKIEVTLHKRETDDTWRVFAKGAKRLKPGDRIVFAEGFAAEVLDKSEEGDVGLRFSAGGAALFAALNRHGAMPLPPYIKRAAPDAADEAHYQTVWAKRDGAVAASTAGLHFSPGLLAALDAAGVERAALTLHVGAGTFLPVKTENVAEHRMHAEWGELSPETADRINAAKADGRRIVAVGTTALRVLETVADDAGRVHAWAGETRLFCLPGFRFRAVDVLMTNFHLPKSTLFMLVCAFAGLERMKAAYAHAIGHGYRFFSYGDSSLIEKAS